MDPVQYDKRLTQQDIHNLKLDDSIRFKGQDDFTVIHSIMHGSPLDKVPRGNQCNINFKGWIDYSEIVEIKVSSEFDIDYVDWIKIIIAVIITVGGIIWFVDYNTRIDYPSTNRDEINTSDSTLLDTIAIDSTLSRKKELINDSIIKVLSPFFNVSVDEFDVDQIKWYVPKSAPKYTNRNGFYCYFNESIFRMKFQYYSDNWLFFKKISFLIDSVPYDYYPINKKRDSGGGKIWESFDDKADLELVKLIIDSKQVKMKLIGEDNYKVINISDRQIRDINKSYQLYKSIITN